VRRGARDRGRPCPRRVERSPPSRGLSPSRNHYNTRTPGKPRPRPRRASFTTAAGPAPAHLSRRAPSPPSPTSPAWRPRP
jgi:hypothetical protein